MLQVPDTQLDDLTREVYGFLGVPIDAVDLTIALQNIAAAIRIRRRYLISTPNVNFILMSLRNSRFRDALLMSDLCPVDGMPVVRMARALGIPINRRVSGADMFRELRTKPVRTFLFGGRGGIASHVCRDINSKQQGMTCVGALNPGFGEVEDLSNESIMSTINASGADFLAVFLSAKKAQEWLLHNHELLVPPVRAQLGATINFEAGLVRRAPDFIRSTGFEWLWRVKEEPYLWRRYFIDALNLAVIFLTSVLPMMGQVTCDRLRRQQSKGSLELEVHCDDTIVLALKGDAIGPFVENVVPDVREVIRQNKPITIDISGLRSLDARFLGLILMLRKQLLMRDLALRVENTPKKIRRWLRWNKFEFLLTN
jgi:N-acetylglucosaminyldiphosphoundecaprenol N-acetyl-beta-D-mannosaminyltransferase